MSPTLHISGYLEISLKIGTTKRSVQKVHRLVALAFIPNLENKLFVDHINGYRADNQVENLRWVTSGENAQNRTRAKKFKTREVIQYNLDGTFNYKWESVISIVNTLKLTRDHIHKACLNGTVLNEFYWSFCLVPGQDKARYDSNRRRNMAPFEYLWI